MNFWISSVAKEGGDYTTRSLARKENGKQSAFFGGPFLCQMWAVGTLCGTAALTNSTGDFAEQGTAGLSLHPAGCPHCIKHIQSWFGSGTLVPIPSGVSMAAAQRDTEPGLSLGQLQGWWAAGSARHPEEALGQSLCSGTAAACGFYPVSLACIPESLN